MQFKKLIEVWGNERAILRGELVLQCGQWVTCGGVKSRYVGHNGRTIDIVHGATTQEVNKKFKQRLEVARQRLEFF